MLRAKGEDEEQLGHQFFIVCSFDVEGWGAKHKLRVGHSLYPLYICSVHKAFCSKRPRSHGFVVFVFWGVTVKSLARWSRI